MNPRERGISNPEKVRPEFKKTIDKAGMVGYLNDGSWRVGFRIPSDKPHSEREIAWSSHEDVFGVLRQHKRVVKKLLGVPLIEEDFDREDDRDGELTIKSYLDQLRSTNFVAGENEYMRLLVQRLNGISASIAAGTLQQDGAVLLLEDVREKLRRAKNPNKIRAREGIEQVLHAGQEVGTADLMNISKHLLNRSIEGTNIVEALIKRGGAILDWSRQQETRLSPLTHTMATVYKTAASGTIDRATWERYFFTPETDQLAILNEVVGNPYNLGKKESERIRSSRDDILQDPLTAMLRFRDLYNPLYDIHQQRRERDSSGQFDLFKPKVQVTRDQEDANFEKQNPWLPQPN